MEGLLRGSDQQVCYVFVLAGRHGLEIYLPLVHIGALDMEFLPKICQHKLHLEVWTRNPWLNFGAEDGIG